MTSPVDKFLSDAVSAARDHADDGVSDGAHTRYRIRESLANQGVARRKRFTLIAAVIASLFGSTAFAYWAGWRPPWTESAAVTESHTEEELDKVSMQLPETRRGSAGSGTVETVVSMEPRPELAAVPDAGLAAEVAPAPAPPPAPVIDTKPKESVRRAKPRAEPRVTTSPVVVEETEPAPPPTPQVLPAEPPTVEAPKPQPSSELAAYRHAHDLHFKGSDPKAALVAWNAYLAKYPDGTLAPEARYARALVFVKLARWAEARTALAPFANGKVGAYRQKEAAEILAAIRDR